MDASHQETQRITDNIPILRDAICCLESRVNVMTAQAPTDISWEAVSERAASEVEKTFEEWVNERVATEVEKGHADQNASPALSSDPAQVTQDELQQVEARATATFKALSTEMLHLKAWVGATSSDTQQSALTDKAFVDGNLKEACKDLKNLQKYLKQVDAILKARFSASEGASAHASESGQSTLSDSSKHRTVFNTTLNKAKPGAARVEISESDQWKPGDVPLLQNQEARTVRPVGSLVLDCPLQNGFDEGVEVRTLLPTEHLEEIEGCTAVTDVGADGN